MEAVNGAHADLSALGFEPEATAIMEVRHPQTNEVVRHDDGRPFTVTLHSRDSAKVVQAERATQDRRISATFRTRQAQLSVNLEKDDVELLVAATEAWDIVIDGGTPEASPKLVRDAYSKYRWLREQVAEFIGARANFGKS